MFAIIGSISTCTLHPVHLASAYIEALRFLASRDKDEERRAQALEGLEALDALLERDNLDEADEALAEFVHESAPGRFEAYCPPYVYFGSLPGDGADIGFWPDIDGLTESANYRDGVICVPAGDEWPALASDIDHVFEVNDHGNVTLFDARTREPLWDCV